MVDIEPPQQQFRLLQAPTNYYITEILDDLQVDMKLILLSLKTSEVENIVNDR